MIFVLLATYIWAGATTAMASVLFREIRILVNELESQEGISQGNAFPRPGLATIITTALIWPAVLPIWLFRYRRGTA